jgi:DNA ligase-1
MMKAERMSSAQEIIKQIGKCLVEPKFDGFRLQVHYLGSDPKGTDPAKVKLFSRSLEDVTFMYPDIVEGVKKEVKANELIIEGEAIGYNPKTGEFLPFQETVQRKRKYDIGMKAVEVPLKLFAFELLYLDGKNFIKKPFIERRKALEEVMVKNADISKQIIVVDHQEEVEKEERLEEIFDLAIAKKLEGVIAKKIDGIYQPGARAWNWIKYKRSYSSKINDTIDCLVMGYDFGKGKRTDFGMGAFLVGVFDSKNDKFVTVAKIGTGLTDEEWKKLKIKSSELRTKNKPENYLVDKMAKCDVWLNPKIVVEIKADEITKSPTHTAGLALRFPRLERFRDDKKPEDITTLEELKGLSLQRQS